VLSVLNPDEACSYHPIFHTYRVVVSRFAEHSSTYNLLLVQQSAYRPFHSTETALLSVHNNLVRSIDNG